MSALGSPREGFDPVGIVEMIGEARRVGGRGAVFALVKRDARLYDAAGVIEQCHSGWLAATRKAASR